jgi:hypothetical protein
MNHHLHAYLRPAFNHPSQDEFIADCRQRLDAYVRDDEALCGLPWAAVHVEQARARKLPLRRRPVGNRLSSALERGDHVLVLDSGLVFQGWDDLLETARVWGELGVTLHLIDLNFSTDDEDGAWALGLLRSFRRSQERRRAERAIEGRHARRTPADPGGSPPYPMRRVGREGRRRLVEDKHLRAIGKRIVELKRSGLSFDRIYFTLLGDGTRTRAGGELSRTTVQNIFRNESALQQQECEAAAQAGIEPPPPTPAEEPAGDFSAANHALDGGLPAT